MSARHIPHGRQRVNPYTMDRLIQTRWKGIVSCPGSTHISQTLTAAKTLHPPTRSRLFRIESVAHMTNRLHSVMVVELGPQSPDAHVDDVASGIEHQAPYIGEQLGPAAHIAGP